MESLSPIFGGVPSSMFSDYYTYFIDYPTLPRLGGVGGPLRSDGSEPCVHVDPS